MKRQILDKRLVIGLYLTFMVSLFLFQNYLFISADNSSIVSDSHLNHVRRFYDNVILEGNISYMNGASTQYPPLVYLVSALFFKHLGFSYFSARLSFFVFSVVFILSMYGIGREMGGTIGGVCVSALAISSAHIIYFSRLYFMDFPQTAMTSLCYYLILKTDNYRKQLFCYLLGIALSLSILTKWSTMFYIVFPLLWFTFPVLFKNVKNFIFTCLTFLFLGFICWKYASYWDFIRNSIFSEDNYIKNWFQPYLYNVLIPSVIFFTAVILLDKYLKPASAGSSAGSEMAGFAKIAVIVSVMISPWLYWSVNAIFFKYQLDSFQFVRNFSHTFNYGLESVKSHYNFLILLFPAGVISIFLNRKDFYKHLSMLIALVFSFFTLSYVGYGDSRYLLSLVIFTLSIGGFWAGYAGILRKPIALFLVVSSILSVTGWTLTENKIFNTLRLRTESITAPFEDHDLFDLRLQRTEPPDLNVLELRPVFRFATENLDRNSNPDLTRFCMYNDYGHYSYYSLPLTEEDFNLEWHRMEYKNIFSDIWGLGREYFLDSLHIRRKSGIINENIIYISDNSRRSAERVRKFSKFLCKKAGVGEIRQISFPFREKYILTVLSFQYPKK